MKPKKQKQNSTYIYGKHALTEALLHTPHIIERVFLAKEVDDPAMRKILKDANVNVSVLGSDKKTVGVSDTAAHQGIIAKIKPEELLRSYDDFVDNLEITENTALVILGELEDPHNVGAIIRSATAFGISGVLIPQHNQAPITGAVVKVSAGMAFRVPLVTISNINTTIKDLKDRGFWIYGLAGEAKQPVSEEKYDRPTVFVLGNEAKGIRQKTREACDILVSIPMNSQCESLNVAASTAVALYAWSSQHPDALLLGNRVTKLG